jgi:signal transduction histidine kinase
MRRGKPEVLVAFLILILLGSYVWYTQRVVATLRLDAQRSTDMYRRIFHAFGDTASEAQSAALFELAKDIRAQGVPLILVDPNGVIGGHANLPFDPGDELPSDDKRIRDYIPILQAQHRPITDPLVGTIYFGDSKVIQRLRLVPVLQALTTAILLLAGLFIIRTRHDAARERLWAGMARESAHQLGTPLSSLSGWVELLEDAANDDRSTAAAKHMRADLERLDRVAHRFERIGREPKFEEIDPGAIIDRLTRYFQARVPTLANTIVVESSVAPDLPKVHGDPVLLEWAVEVLTKNAIDALAGRGGHVRLSAERGPDDSVIMRVADDGPGVPRELRDRVFEPGFSTKKSGWGIGLSLARRIVQENHGGKLVLAPATQGATFEIILS